MIKGVQISVKFQNGGTYASFESSKKKRVDWDSISDSEYEQMMDEAISAIVGMKEQYKHQEWG